VASHACSRTGSLARGPGKPTSHVAAHERHSSARPGRAIARRLGTGPTPSLLPPIDEIGAHQDEHRYGDGDGIEADAVSVLVLISPLGPISPREPVPACATGFDAVRLSRRLPRFARFCRMQVLALSDRAGCSGARAHVEERHCSAWS